MFGKPQWFRERKSGKGLFPATWQGVVYFGVWGLVIAVPFLIFAFAVEARQLEAVIWLGVSIAALVFDTRKVKKAMRAEERANLMYIGDDEGESHVSTRNYDLHVRE